MSNNINCNELEGTLKSMCLRSEGLSADVSNFFLIWASSLVLFMHAGFAMLSAGALRTKNTRNILISIVMDLTVCAISWYICGFAFAFGNDQGGFIGSSFWVGIDVGSTDTGTSSFYFWLFQYCFAATSATIVSGAVAERARFESYLFYSAFISAWTYPMVVHWVWGGGFLTLGNGKGNSLMGSGVVDFAGCGPVHMVGGLTGAICSKVMGPRIGRFDPETNEPFPMPGHSSPLATLGVFILWVGWFGFNPGSVINITGGNGATASRAAVMTVLSSASAALSSLLIVSRTRGSEREFDLNMALNGALAGLVSITGCCAFVEMWAAIAIGTIGGVIYVYASKFTLYGLKIDDPLDATPVHLFCGMWGIIAGAFFANPVLLQPFFPVPSSGQVSEVPAGIFYGADTYATIHPDGSITVGGNTKGALIANAIVEIACILAWVSVLMTPLFLLLRKLEVLRVASDVELVGLDISHHGGQAYTDVMTMWNYTEVKETNHSDNHSDNNTTSNRAGEDQNLKHEDNVVRIDSASQNKMQNQSSQDQIVRLVDKSTVGSSSPIIKVKLEESNLSDTNKIPILIYSDREKATAPDREEDKSKLETDPKSNEASRATNDPVMMA